MDKAVDVRGEQARGPHEQVHLPHRQGQHAGAQPTLQCVYASGCRESCMLLHLKAPWRAGFVQLLPYTLASVYAPAADTYKGFAGCGLAEDRLCMQAVEVTIQNLITSGMDPKTQNDPYLGFIYTSFQERATKISHGNTASHAAKHGAPSVCKSLGTC